MNIGNINRLIATLEIAGNDERFKDYGFSMNVWDSEVCEEDDTSGHNCGSAMCIGGYCNALSGHREESMSAAALFLGIYDHLDHDELFYPSSEDWGWDAFNKATPEHAINVLKHLRDTGKIDWSPEVAGYNP